MNKEKLKQAEIKEGNICLEGRVLQNPKFLALKTLSTVFGNITDTKEEKQDRFYENIVGHAPTGADSYIVGTGFPRLIAEVLSGYYAVLYLSSGINEEK